MSEPGYVYILTNPSFREDWVKIGKSSRTVDVRSKELDNTAVPLPFEIYATMKTVKYNEAEKLVHKYIERFTDLRIRNNREFFNVKPEIALEIFKDVAGVIDDAVIEEVYKNSMLGENVEATSGPRKKTAHLTTPRKEKRIWLIPSSKKFYDLEASFKKYGSVCWSQYFDYQKGDEAYIYSGLPDSAILYKVLVDAHDMKYGEEVEREREFYYNPADADKRAQYNRFARFKLIQTTHNLKLSLPHLLEHGLKAAPQGVINLSSESKAELLRYIEENFK